MKRVVSISIGSSKRDKSVEVELLGKKLPSSGLGQMEIWKRLPKCTESSTKGGRLRRGWADLGMYIGDKWYDLYSVQKLVRFVKTTPLADGAGIKNTLEYRLASFVDQHIGDYIKERKAFVMTGVDRWGMGNPSYGLATRRSSAT